MLGVGLRGRKEGVTLGSVMYEVNVVYLHGIWLHSEMFCESLHMQKDSCEAVVGVVFFGQNHNDGHQKVMLGQNRNVCELNRSRQR